MRLPGGAWTSPAMVLPADDVNRVAEDDRACIVPCVGQPPDALPLRLARAKAIHVAQHRALRLGLAAEDVDRAAEDCGAGGSARRRRRRRRRSRRSCCGRRSRRCARGTRLLRGCLGAWQRRQLRPGVRLRVEDQMLGERRDLVPAAEDADLAAEDDSCMAAARRRERSAQRPLARRGIEHLDRCRGQVRRPLEAADDVDATAEGHRGRRVERRAGHLRQVRQARPSKRSTFRLPGPPST